MEIKHCTTCGSPTIQQIPLDDDLTRDVCSKCGLIHYKNPILVVGCIPQNANQILLCKRNIEPRKHKWTLPAGYLENEETVEQGAFRETLEESLAKVDIIAPYRMFNIVHVNQIYLMFRSKMVTKNFGPTKESSEVQLFHEKDIPWHDIAFPVIKETLKDFFHDRKKNDFPFKIKDIVVKLSELS